ncbi:MAG: hypothetical protein GWP59_04150 [Chlamydiales bacterium]|nr:hypothetical protein [Chlamydiales bacterium]NCF70876.1 hypothetical protein [Chlamydiales bacterium]
MKCPLCNATNDLTATICHLCGEELSESESTQTAETPTIKKTTVSIESVDITKSKLSKKKLTTAIAALVLFCVPWVFMSDLLFSPWETMQSRNNFQSAVTQYSSNANKWDKQKEDILLQMKNQRLNKEIGKEQLQYNYLPIEVVLSFISNDLGFGKGALKDSTLFLDPEDDSLSTFILSKYEEGSWPLNILLSLRVKLDSSQNTTQVNFLDFKRGKRKVSVDLAWDYFTPELQALRLLESYYGGIHNFKITKSQQRKAVNLPSNSQFQVTWNYSHPNFFPERLPVN